MQHVAMIGGLIWDEELKKFAAYKDLSKHPNPNIWDCWTISGEIGFGCLFQGFGTTEGMDVLDFILFTEVLPSKTVTFLQYMGCI